MWLCRKVRKLLGAYQDSELDARWLDRVRQHVEQCTGCREELERLRRISSVGAAHRVVPDVSAPEWERRWSRIREHIATPAPAAFQAVAPTAPRVSWVWRRPVLASLAMAVAVIAVGTFIAFGRLPWTPTAQAKEPGCVVTLIETDVENASVMYYHCAKSDLSVITLIPGKLPNGGG